MELTQEKLCLKAIPYSARSKIFIHFLRVLHMVDKNCCYFMTGTTKGGEDKEDKKKVQ